MPGLLSSTAATLLLATLLSGAQARTPAPLRTELTLTHVAANKWRADYVFSEPVTAVDLGAQIGAYRKQAWRPLTPGVELRLGADKEQLHSSKPLTRLSVEISAYDGYVDNNYAPINRFSDGGSHFYLGFLHGVLRQRGRERSMDVALKLRGLHGETVVAPGRPGTDLAGYAYFGSGRPAPMGRTMVIVDPLAPPWLLEVIQETSAKVSAFYEQAFQRPLLQAPLVAIAVTGFDGKPGSMNMKGGASGGGITYRLQGQGLIEDHPRKRQYLASLVAHELAHLWQTNLKRGGVGEDEPWIHEGGAEALMLAALRATGIFTEEATEQYAQRLLKECDQLKDDLTVYRGVYACGFKRFNGYAIAPVPLWRGLMERSEASGEFYSEAMIRALLKDAPARP